MPKCNLSGPLYDKITADGRTEKLFAKQIGSSIRSLQRVLRAETKPGKRMLANAAFYLKMTEAEVLQLARDQRAYWKAKAYWGPVASVLTFISFGLLENIHEASMFKLDADAIRLLREWSDRMLRQLAGSEVVTMPRGKVKVVPLPISGKARRRLTDSEPQDTSVT